MFFTVDAFVLLNRVAWIGGRSGKFVFSYKGGRWVQRVEDRGGSWVARPNHQGCRTARLPSPGSGCLARLASWSEYLVSILRWSDYLVWLFGLTIWSGYLVWVLGLTIWSDYLVWLLGLTPWLVWLSRVNLTSPKAERRLDNHWVSSLSTN